MTHGASPRFLRVVHVDLFISPEHRELLAASELDSFDEAWQRRAEWFEEPNVRRGGWSGVCRLGLRSPAGGEVGVFMKRQENHQRRSLRHPLSGEPTFAREFRMLRYLEDHRVPAPRPVFFAADIVDGKPRGILMTEELAGYRPLDVVVDELFADGARPPVRLQRDLLAAVAHAVRQLHDARVQHSSLYPKHLFVRLHDDAVPDVALIDLEKSRTTLLAPLRTVHDLDALNRHSAHWTRSARLFFLLQYLGLPRLTPWARLVCRWIMRRAHKRQ